MKKYRVTFYSVEGARDLPGEFLRGKKRREPRVFTKCVSYVAMLEEHGLALPQQYVKKVADNVWELRPEFGGIEYRLFFGQIGPGEFGLVSAYQKTWDTIPKQITDTATARIEEMRR